MIEAIHLRDVRESDLPILFEHQLDPDATRMAAFPARSREAFMAHWAKIMANESSVLKTIVFNGRVAGSLACLDLMGEREFGTGSARFFG